MEKYNIMQKKYPSKYSNGKEVSAAQYITEMICEKMAIINKRDLHYRFWLTPEWEKFYRNQISSAHKLLKKYPDIAIVRALNNSKATKIYSLRAPHLVPIIEQEQVKLSQQNQNLSVDLSRKQDINYSKPQPTKNIISKLKDLE